MFKIISITLFITLSLAISAKEVQLVGKGDFNLYGDYTASKKPSKKGVLMLHQCNADKTMYQGLAKKLSRQGINSMSLDFRGYGKSIKEGQSIKIARENATSRENYFKLLDEMKLQDHRSSDVELAYQYLASQLGKDAEISFIGASCGGTQAIIAAQKHKPNAFIFFSAGMNQENQEKFHNLSDIPALIIASQDDVNTFKTANSLFLGAKNTETRLLSYKGGAHGLPLFKQDKELEGTMVNWFKGHF